MTAPSQLSRAIRFALSNLGSQNAHHDFEHLCRQIAKRRIASNVIPATDQSPLVAIRAATSNRSAPT